MLQSISKPENFNLAQRFSAGFFLFVCFNLFFFFLRRRGVVCVSPPLKPGVSALELKKRFFFFFLIGLGPFALSALLVAGLISRNPLATCSLVIRRLRPHFRVIIPLLKMSRIIMNYRTGVRSVFLVFGVDGFHFNAAIA